MQFLFHPNAGNSFLEIDGDLYKYLFKIRRHEINDEFNFRNLDDKFLYKYEINNISKKNASFKLLKKEEKIVLSKKKLHIGWCKIDSKSIEKVIATLNEIGVDRITFILCKYSQGNSKINFEKLHKILINSSQQCGRSNIIKLDEVESLDEFLTQNPNSFLFNFSTNLIESSKNEIDTIIIGCEGGFSKSELDKFNSSKIVGINSSLILRSESAVSVVASKVIS